MTKKIVATGFLAFAAIACFAVVSDGVSLAWKPKAGSSFKYSYKTEVPDKDFKVSAQMVETIKDVKSDGTVLLEDKQSQFAGTAGGQDIGGMLPPSITDTITEKANGEVVSRKSDAPEGMSQPRLDSLSQMIYPDHPVNAGDSWTFDGKGDKAKGTYDFTFSYKFIGPEEADGIASNKVSVEYKETNADKPITASGTAWLSAEDGQLVKVDMKVKNVELGPGGVADLSVAIDRVK